MADDKQLTTLDLMQPEILAVEDLQQVLCQRLPTVNLAGASKSALVSLWHRLVTPLPQRVYPDTVTGRRYAARQRRYRPPPDCDWTTSSRLLSGPPAPRPSTSSPATSRGLVATTGDRLKPPPTGPTGDRLKPPPVLAGKRRIIKLSGGSRTAGGATSGLDGAVIRRRSGAGSTVSDAADTSAATTARAERTTHAKTNDVKVESGAAVDGAAPSEPKRMRKTLLKTEASSVEATQGSGDASVTAVDGADSEDIKTKLQHEKRKLKRRKTSDFEPKLKRLASDDANGGSVSS